MGYSTAVDIAGNTDSLEHGLKIHFQSNCYPRIPLAMIPVGIEAINNIVEAEISRDYELLDKVIQLPEGIEFRGSNTVTSIQAVESLFLGAFVDTLLWEAGEEE